MSNISVAIGADHGGYGLKTDLLPFLNQLGIKVLDLGACTYDSADDYPDFASAVARKVACGQTDRGIIICGSGVGACITANKIKGVRAGLCHDVYSAHQGVEHDDMNVLCLGARVIGIEVAKEIITAFLNARFTGEERHKRRLEKLLQAEKEG
ncbi:MAG: ribose 5-phosphate isomerase B [Dehalococcoides mccartyi]|uniref:ribose 5-phosphate isomerase B n=1 Tax=Dehalococcoides mccartyi TaxID=61435 RepID=UPI0030F6037C